MKIVIHIPDHEATREIECEEENIRPAYKQVIRKIEDVMTYHQIRYTEIRALFRDGETR